MTSEHLSEVLTRFGYGESSHSGFPGESAGVLAPPQTWGMGDIGALALGAVLGCIAVIVRQELVLVVMGGVFAYLSGHSVFSEYLGIPRVPGAGELAVVCAAIAGSGLGFLWFNTYPAMVFMPQRARWACR